MSQANASATPASAGFSWAANVGEHAAVLQAETALVDQGLVMATAYLASRRQCHADAMRKDAIRAVRQVMRLATLQISDLEDGCGPPKPAPKQSQLEAAPPGCMATPETAVAVASVPALPPAHIPRRRAAKVEAGAPKVQRRKEGLPGALLVAPPKPSFEAPLVVPQRPDPAAEAVIPSTAKITRAPSRPDMRFHVDPSHRGDFLSDWDAKRRGGAV